jgi:hypothetical protein
MFVVASLYAAEETQCEQCRKAVDQEWTNCVNSAISQEDKKTCGEKRDLRMKTCEDGVCKIGTGK